MTLHQFQECAHPAGHDYRSGSPHLKHARLYDALVARLRVVIEELFASSTRVSVLDVGAGHGRFSEGLLALGCDVVATEMSRSSFKQLSETYARNPRFSAVLDMDGTLAPVGEQRFSLLLYASVLHHIPDYLSTLQAAVRDHLEPGGALLTFQDPLWYPRQSVVTRAFSQLAYFSWRVTQGELRRGLRTRLRRARGVYSADEPADMVEYHVTRRGVDEQALIAAFAPHFRSVAAFRYWSTQAGAWQHIGDALRLVNTFGMTCTGYVPRRESSADLRLPTESSSS